ncbi:MAG: hypothetical protein A2V67_18820 [Deltaproteobacteria bacterium RBG_13_61_14]|nr:MAG: hypothetical protein A2V67_18820 [Deltaproteobacteria bacterium RBG_13_61_14]
MGRPTRVEFPGAIHHVTARGNDRKAIFFYDDNRKNFLDLLDRAASRFRLEIFAFCLMTNHYHLFLRTAEPNLAAAMKWLNGLYSARLNRSRNRSGHLFQNRYHSVLVTKEPHWLHLSMYLHLNPVRAGMVQDPCEYEWSSFRDYIQTRSRFDWLCPQEVLSQYGATPNEQRRQYRRDCLGFAGVGPSFWKQLLSEVGLGVQVVRAGRASGPSPPLSHKSVSDTKGTDVETELRRVATVFRVEPLSLLRRRSRNFPARLAAYYHLVEHCGMDVRAVAKTMAVSGSAVSRGISRFKKMMESAPAWKKAIHALKS